MSRLHTPASIEASPAASQPLLEGVRKQLGGVPNMFRVIASSPAALEGYLGLGNALGRGKLDARTRARLALVVAEQNGCDYCLSAHTYLGLHLAKISPEEIALNRKGASGDAKANAAVSFAAKVARERGHVGEADIAAVRERGFTDAEVVEIIALVAENSFTNYLNEAAKTEIDFPVVRAANEA